MSDTNTNKNNTETKKTNPQEAPPTSTLSSTSTTENTVDFTTGTSAADFRYYPDDPNSVLNKLEFASKQPSKFYDPCAETSRMSIRCMEINGPENKAVCNEYFQAYRDCKKAWLEQRRRDRFENRGW